MADTPLYAVVLGCSAFRVCVPGYISELETETGVSIVTSTQVRWLRATPVPNTEASWAQPKYGTATITLHAVQTDLLFPSPRRPTRTQAFYWNCLRTGGVEDQIDGYGRLFQEF